jgi:hypothetical protein
VTLELTKRIPAVAPEMVTETVPLWTLGAEVRGAVGGAVVVVVVLVVARGGLPVTVVVEWAALGDDVHPARTRAVPLRPIPARALRRRAAAGGR